MQELSAQAAVQPVFQLQDLCWTAADKLILNDLNCEIYQGRLTGIIGPNGAGKTSLLRCLNRYYQPTAGKVIFKGQLIEQWSHKALAQNIALVSQQTALAPHITVEQLMMTGLIPYKSWFEGTSAKDFALIDQLLKETDLQDKKTQVIGNISGGELQRLLIAKALVQRSDCLLLDEPTNHLDYHYQPRLLAYIKSLHKTVVASLHDINLAARFCDDLLLMKQGELIASGPVVQVFTEQHLSELFDCQVRVDKHPFYNQLWMNFVEEPYYD